MNRFLAISLGLLATGIAVALLLFFTGSDDTGPVTCKNDEQCGGTIIADRFCREGNLWGSGQQNTCVNAGNSDSRCETTYNQFLVETCKNGCASNGCV